MASRRSGIWVSLAGTLCVFAVAWFLWPRGDPTPTENPWPPAEVPGALMPQADPTIAAPETDGAQQALLTAAPAPRWPANLTMAWERALALHTGGRSDRALRSLATLMQEYAAFFEEPPRPALLAAMREAEQALWRDRKHTAVLRDLVEAARQGDARLPLGGDDAEGRLLRELGAGAQIIAKVDSEKEREQMTRHVERFLLAEWHAEGDKPSWIDLGLKRLLDDPIRKLPTLKRLSVVKPEEVASRRLAQLDHLRTRDAIWSLDTIHGGLVWLALNQGKDGRISDDAFLERVKERKEKAPKGIVKQTGAMFATASTALGVIALLDFRDQDARGLFEPHLALAVDWLLKQQGKDGGFSGRYVRGNYYTEAIALMALGQAAAASGDERVRKALERGLAHLHAQAGPYGGYRYRSKEHGDVSVSGWVAQAVEMAQRAGAEIPVGMVAGLSGFLDHQSAGLHEFHYGDPQDGGWISKQRPSLFPVGMLMGRILWPEIPDATREDWRTWLRTGQTKSRPDLYTLYYGVRVSILLEERLADPWRSWTQQVAEAQLKEGPLAGSFPTSLSRWMRRAGVTVNTTMALLTVEHALYLR